MRNPLRRLWTGGLLAALALPAAAAETPVELGAVGWHPEGYEAGRKEAARAGKPLLLLFQEVPG